MISAEFFKWRIEQADLGGDWSWLKADHQMLLTKIIPKLQDYETMTWADVESGTGSHFVSKTDCIKEARQRLDDLELDDIEELFSLRITGKRRAWGIRNVAVLHLLWWDPEHEVCPSRKKNT